MTEARVVHDPFYGVDVQISDRLVDRLRGKYAYGPHLPNGNPEFGWRQFQSPPIQHEAADRIEALEAELLASKEAIKISDQVVKDAMASYLKTCGTGGMPRKQREEVLNHVANAARLQYFSVSLASKVVGGTPTLVKKKSATNP